MQNRIGVAKSDASKNFVQPLATIARKGLDRKAEGCSARFFSVCIYLSSANTESVHKVAKNLAAIIVQERISGVVVGYPVLPSGAQSPLCIEIEWMIQQFAGMGLVSRSRRYGSQIYMFTSTITVAGDSLHVMGRALFICQSSENAASIIGSLYGRSKIKRRVLGQERWDGSGSNIAGKRRG